MAGGFGGASFGSLMGYSYYGMPNYKGKLKKSWFVKSPLTNKFGRKPAEYDMKKAKSKGKNPGSHPAGYTSNKPVKYPMPKLKKAKRS